MLRDHLMMLGEQEKLSLRADSTGFPRDELS